MDEIRKQLQCRSCMLPLFPPILKCERGDSVCEECRKKYGKCPLCKGNLTDKHDEVLEALTKLSCYNCNKCNESLKLIELKDHFKKCLKNMKVEKVCCPIEKCTWKGEALELPDHWISKKLALHPYVEDNMCRAKLTNKNSYFANMVKAHDSIFFFKSSSNEGKFFWALQYVGRSDQVEKFWYEIEIFNPNRLLCKFILTSYCQSINLPNASLFKESICIFTPKELLEPYLTDDETLLYSLRVHQVNEVELEKQRKKVTKLLERNTKK